MATSTRKGSAASAAPKSSAKRSPKPTGGNSSVFEADIEQRIAERAYEIYLERGGEGGDSISDWLRAEAEIRGSQPEVIKKARPPRTSERGRKSKATDKEMQQLSDASAGGF